MFPYFFISPQLPKTYLTLSHPSLIAMTTKNLVWKRKRPLHCRPCWRSCTQTLVMTLTTNSNLFWFLPNCGLRYSSQCQSMLSKVQARRQRSNERMAFSERDFFEFRCFEYLKENSECEMTQFFPKIERGRRTRIIIMIFRSSNQN